MAEIIQIAPFYDPNNIDQPVMVKTRNHRSGHLFVQISRGGRRSSAFFLSGEDIEQIGGKEEVQSLIEHGICNSRCDFLLLIDSGHRCEQCPS